MLRSASMGHLVVHHEVIPERSPAIINIPDSQPFSDMEPFLKGLGIRYLYSHQSEAISLIASGKNVVVSTPTASGKTLIYNLPVLASIYSDPLKKALYLFPLKALAQDQLKAVTECASKSKGYVPDCAVYDGDTSAWHRRKLRNNPPNILISNPEMLHLSFLPYHASWRDFISGIKYLVADEIHTYRGVMGSHMANVFRRFDRICAYYGAKPTYIFTSATIANPVELAEKLTGKRFEPVQESGAPCAKKHFIFINPQDSPAHTAIQLLKAALARGLRTIVYTDSRKMSELISLWAGASGRFSGKISAYRAGILPENRREIEQKLSSGELLAVISTSALELGIDIGDLDICILVGYPGTIISTLQRGGRVGRRGKESAVILIAGEDALDQYIIRTANEFISKPPESALINPENPQIIKKHLLCAASELSIKTSDPVFNSPAHKLILRQLEKEGELLLSASGGEYHCAKKAPHREISLRGTGSRFSIIDAESEKIIGDIDGFRAFRETHPGAIYLQEGITYRVIELDYGSMTVLVKKAKASYYTRPMSCKETRILEQVLSADYKTFKACFGRLEVTDQVTGYEKLSLAGSKKIQRVNLDLPPQVFQTEGIWIVIPENVRSRMEKEKMHFMGGIHALEHAMIGVAPLFLLVDRNDLGGISIPLHPQVGQSAVFVYDSIPGGIGLAAAMYEKILGILEKTNQIITTCPCEYGCPGCVHSPKCGSGNRPIDKGAALFVLRELLAGNSCATTNDPADSYPREKTSIEFGEKNDAGDAEDTTTLTGRSEHEITVKETQKPEAFIQKNIQIDTNASYAVLDIETQYSATEVGGWSMAHKMKVSCAVLYDSTLNDFLTFLEGDIQKLLDSLFKYDFIVGFNIKRFDYRVLSGYSPVFPFHRIPTIDILEHIQARLGFRLSLDHIAKHTLGDKKTADGLQALKWWKAGEVEKIIDYCISDVRITNEIFIYALRHGYLLFKNKSGSIVRLPLDFKLS